MNHNAKIIIENVIAEAALDSRIYDGIVDLGNSEHLVVIAEKMNDVGVDEQVINEFIEQFMEEGKYPDRQAYNRDGWLVTFPSKEYRDAAIKKGTHSVSDPTHGKGGMNLYYKKKGKQKRQTQQSTSSVDTKKNQAPIDAVRSGGQTATTDTKSSTANPAQRVAADNEPAPEKASSSETPEQEFDRLSGSDEESEPEPDAVSTEPTPSPVAKQKSITPATEPPQSTSTPQPTPPKPDYEEISKKFVTQKRWMPTEFGEYRDTQGNTVAVVGLSGEIVPVRNTDREEYKLFAEKNMPQQ